MLNSLHLPPGFDVLAGGQPLVVVAAAVIVLIVLGSLVSRRAGQSGLGGTLLGGALVLLGALVASVLTGVGEDAVLRRSVDTRAAELTARAMAPGSALACLDAVANADVEAACEKALFATPEAVANAIAYVDARISLLAASAPLAARDPSYQPSIERTRRALEADRFGLVAHVLHTRGCEAAGCADLQHIRNSSHILTNMKAQTFGSYVSLHASGWQANGGTLATATVPPMAGLAALPMTIPPATIGASKSVPDQFEFPSAASIPAVSIMNAEPSAPPTTAAEPQSEPRAAPTPPRRAAAQSARRQTAREAPPREPPPREAAPQGPPGALPPPPPLPHQPQTSGQR